ncbi:MAG: serine/threonine-protein kinase [Candidatus Aminicenantes bacterium]|jgi:serine/threonine-protein kinase
MVKFNMIGKILGNYRILKKIGEGGMGSVYLARDLSLEREVAIKIIAPELARNPGLMARFRVEAIAQAKLNHTNIVTIHSFDQEKDIYYIVMEYMEGKTLKAAIKEQENIPVVQALKIFSQLLGGMAYAHAQGVVHRDIKPSNIFLTGLQVAKIGDFGIAKVEGIEGLTKVGTTLGSPVYSSPEQLLGKKVDARTDVYSLGITLYEMLTGAPPLKIKGKGDYEAIKQTLDFTPQPPSAINPAIPAPVDAMIMKSIAKDPAHRFQDVNEFDREVKQVISSLTPVPETPAKKKKAPVKPLPASPGKTKKPFKLAQNKQQLAIALGLIAILLIVVVFLLVSGEEPAIQTGSDSKSSTPDQPVTGRSAAEMPPILQPHKPTTQEPPVITEPKSHTTRELPSITGIDTISDILKKMDWLIKKEYYKKAVNLGEKTIKDGTVSGQIYLAIAQAYYCDGKKDQARIYYMKALELEGYLSFSVGYQYEKDKIINGTLSIARQNIYFKPSKENLNRYAFSIPMTQIKRVSLDTLGDIGRLFKKKENRKDPILIIRDKKKNKYNLQVRNSYKKSRSFVKDILNTLRKM